MSACALAPLCHSPRSCSQLEAAATALPDKERKLQEQLTPREEKRQIEVEHRLLVREAVYLLGVQLKQKGKKSIEATAAKRDWEEKLNKQSFNNVSLLALERLEGRNRERFVYYLEEGFEE